MFNLKKWPQNELRENVYMVRLHEKQAFFLNKELQVNSDDSKYRDPKSQFNQL